MLKTTLSSIPASLLCIILLCASALGCLSVATPESDPVESPGATLAHQLIQAHGGMDRWKAAPSVSFQRKMRFAFAPEDPWVYTETTEQAGKRRSYQEWPRDGARLGYDGTQLWTVGWQTDRRGGPGYNVNIGYYFMMLPWLTQDPGVVLEDRGTARLPDPADSTDYQLLRMTFETTDDYYTIFIDPETHQMKGIEYDIEGAPLPGPFTHVMDAFATVDELLVVTKYRTYQGEGQVFAEHTNSDWSFRQPFDESRLEMPTGAVLDPTFVAK